MGKGPKSKVEREEINNNMELKEKLSTKIPTHNTH
jgi:hypothetical protein